MLMVWLFNKQKLTFQNKSELTKLLLQARISATFLFCGYEDSCELGGWKRYNFVPTYIMEILFKR